MAQICRAPRRGVDELVGDGSWTGPLFGAFFGKPGRVLEATDKTRSVVQFKIILGAAGAPCRTGQTRSRMGGFETSRTSRPVTIGPQQLDGVLELPAGAKGMVIFAHGSGSSRHSPRNIHVAKNLQSRGLGTLLFDLLTEQEASDRRAVFNISLLATRVVEVVRWTREQEIGSLPIGLFGASTGAAAALAAAADLPGDVAAVVSRGGRPDLAGPALPHVRAPTLLIVGGADYGVIELNQQALGALRCEKRLEIVPGATHLFEELGTLARVIDLAGAWFETHLQAVPT
jgi:putative phosphoribosyl transferase